MKTKLIGISLIHLRDLPDLLEDVVLGAEIRPYHAYASIIGYPFLLQFYT